MKKILAIGLVFALMLSMIFIVGQVSADYPYSTVCYSTGSDFNWTIMDDFFDMVHGQVRIHGKVYGNSQSGDISSSKPLSKATVSIRLINSDFNFFSPIIEPVVPIIDISDFIDDDIEFPSWDSDFPSIDDIIDIPDITDISDIDDILNFSSIKTNKPIIKKSFNDYISFKEKNIIVNPASEITDFTNISIEQIKSYWHFWRLVFTDENGEFEFNFLQPGTYEIKANKIGYESLTKTITVEEGSAEVDFVLNASEIAYVFDDILLDGNLSFENVSNYFKARMQIDDGIINGNVGCKIVVNTDIGNNLYIYTDGLTINVTNVTDNKISIKINGNENMTGKTIVIHVQGEFFYDLENLIIEYDGGEIRMADNLDDVLNPDDDGSHPEYWIIHDANGTHILVSVPHFSEHEITVYSLASAASTPALTTSSDILIIIAVYAMICAVAAIIFVGSIGLRKKFR